MPGTVSDMDGKTRNKMLSLSTRCSQISGTTITFYNESTMSNVLQKKKLLILTKCLIWEEVTEEVLQHHWPAKARTRLPGERKKKFLITTDLLVMSLCPRAFAWSSFSTWLIISDLSLVVLMGCNTGDHSAHIC